MTHHLLPSLEPPDSTLFSINNQHSILFILYSRPDTLLQRVAHADKSNTVNITRRHDYSTGRITHDADNWPHTPFDNHHLNSSIHHEGLLFVPTVGHPSHTRPGSTAGYSPGSQLLLILPTWIRWRVHDILHQGTPPQSDRVIDSETYGVNTDQI